MLFGWLMHSFKFFFCLYSMFFGSCTPAGFFVGSFIAVVVIESEQFRESFSVFFFFCFLVLFLLFLVTLVVLTLSEQFPKRFFRCASPLASFNP
jgi:L-cystine uptake protein TcyP (sodium:dicarboxylate symporter family)